MEAEILFLGKIMAKKEKNNIEFAKIVYFDEESATDLIYMNNKGQIVENITKKSVTSTDNVAKVEATAGVRAKVLSLLNLRLESKASGNLGYNSERLLNQAITNTVLTDYLDMLNDKSIKIGVQKFSSAKVYAFKDSMTYFKLMTPYFTMTEGLVDAGDFKLNIQKMDSALEQGRGYFEMVLDDAETKKILRFNLKSFKAAYSLSDLVKMSLTYHAVKVGEMNLNNLSMSQEFLFQDEQTSKIISGSKLARGEDAIISNEGIDIVDVYDVLLAGVSND